MCVCVSGERCGHLRSDTGGAGGHAAQHEAGRQCESGGGEARGVVPASRAGKTLLNVVRSSVFTFFFP